MYCTKYVILFYPYKNQKMTRKWIFMKASKSDTYKIYKVTSRIILCSHHYSITSSGYITEEQRWEHKIEKRWCPFFFQQQHSAKPGRGVSGPGSQTKSTEKFVASNEEATTIHVLWCFVSNWLALTSFWAGHESIDLWNKLVWGFVRSPSDCWAIA